MHPARLFILCGLPGSGTSTRAAEIAERFTAVRLSADDWMRELDIDIWNEGARARIEAMQRDLAMRTLRGGSVVVVEWGSWSRSERDLLWHAARDVGALVHLELLDAPVDELWDRVRRRGREQLHGSRAIARADIDEWAAMIELPTADELRRFDPMPPIRAGERPGSPAYPYGSWRP